MGMTLGSSVESFTFVANEHNVCVGCCCDVGYRFFFVSTASQFKPSKADGDFRNNCHDARMVCHFFGFSCFLLINVSSYWFLVIKESNLASFLSDVWYVMSIVPHSLSH